MSVFWAVIDVILAAVAVRYIAPQLDGVAVLLVVIFGVLVAWWKVERG